MSDHQEVPDTRGSLFLGGTLYWPKLGGGYVKAIMGGSNPDPGDGGGDDAADAPDDDSTDAPDDNAPKAKGKAKAPARRTGGDGDVPDPVGEWFNALPPEGKQYFRDLKRTASGNSRKAREAQAQLDAVQQSTMSTEQRLQVALEREQTARQRAETQLRDQSIRGAFTREGGQAGAKDAGALWKLVDPEDIQWDPETGEVLNAAELVENLRRNYAWAFEDRRPSAGVDAGRRTAPQRQGPSQSDMMNQLIRGRRT